MRPLRRPFRVATVSVVAAAAACTVSPLNPQPLPPAAEENAAGSTDGGDFSATPDARTSDPPNQQPLDLDGGRTDASSDDGGLDLSPDADAGAEADGGDGG